MLARVVSDVAGPSFSRISPAAKTASVAWVQVPVVAPIPKLTVANAPPFFFNVKVVEAVAAMDAIAIERAAPAGKVTDLGIPIRSIIWLFVPTPGAKEVTSY